MKQIVPVQDCIHNQLTDCCRRQFVPVLTHKTVNLSALVYVLHYKHAGIFYLLIQRPAEFLAVKKVNFFCSFKKRALDFSEIFSITREKIERRRRMQYAASLF